MRSEYSGAGDLTRFSLLTQPLTPLWDAVLFDTDEAKKSISVTAQLECSICLEPYNAAEPSRIPRILLCGHSFCTKDLEIIIATNGNCLDCPTCRHVTEVPPVTEHSHGQSSAHSLHVNYALMELLDILQKAEKIDVCDQCEASKSTLFCHCKFSTFLTISYPHKKLSNNDISVRIQSFSS